MADALSRRKEKEEEEKCKREANAMSVVKPLWMTNVIKSYNENSKATELLIPLAVNATSMPEYFYRKGFIKYKRRNYVGKGGQIKH